MKLEFLKKPVFFLLITLCFSPSVFGGDGCEDRSARAKPQPILKYLDINPEEFLGFSFPDLSQLEELGGVEVDSINALLKKSLIQ